MQDFASSKYSRKKSAYNKPKTVKKTRKPIDWRKFLRLSGKFAFYLSILSIFSIASLFCYRTVMAATFFQIKDIEVAGSKHVSKEEVLATAAVAPGQSLLRLNLPLVGKQLKTNPWVDKIHVRRDFPDKLSITLTEREPLAVVSMGLLYYLDAKGEVFKVLNKGDSLNYPVITGFTEDEMSADPAGTKEALKSACALLAILHDKESKIFAETTEVHYDKGYGLTFFVSSSVLPVRVGSGDFEAKIGRLSLVYKDLMDTKTTIQDINVDFGDKVIVKRIAQS